MRARAGHPEQRCALARTEVTVRAEEVEHLKRSDHRRGGVCCHTRFSLIDAGRTKRRRDSSNVLAKWGACLICVLLAKFRPGRWFQRSSSVRIRRGECSRGCCGGVDWYNNHRRLHGSGCRACGLESCHPLPPPSRRQSSPGGRVVVAIKPKPPIRRAAPITPTPLTQHFRRTPCRTVPRAQRSRSICASPSLVLIWVNGWSARRAGTQQPDLRIGRLRNEFVRFTLGRQSCSRVR